MFDYGYGFGCGQEAAPFSAGASLASFLHPGQHTDITRPPIQGMPLPPTPTVPGVHTGLVHPEMTCRCSPMQTQAPHASPFHLPFLGR